MHGTSHYKRYMEELALDIINGADGDLPIAYVALDGTGLRWPTDPPKQAAEGSVLLTRLQMLHAMQAAAELSEK